MGLFGSIWSGIKGIGSTIGSAIGSVGKGIGTAVGTVAGLTATVIGKVGAPVGATIGTFVGGPFGTMVGKAIGGAVQSLFSKEEVTGRPPTREDIYQAFEAELPATFTPEESASVIQAVNLNKDLSSLEKEIATDIIRKRTIGREVTPTPGAGPSGCFFVATEVYPGPIPQKFYDFRERLPISVVRIYYEMGRSLVPLIRELHLRKPIRFLLDLCIR